MSTSVLIADDNAPVRTLFMRLIRRTDPQIHVLEVESGQAALDVCAQHHPELVLLDHGLPDISGFTVLQHIKGQQDAPYVVIITGDSRLETDALAQGADEVWLKPMDVSNILTHLTHLLSVS